MGGGWGGGGRCSPGWGNRRGGSHCSLRGTGRGPGAVRGFPSHTVPEREWGGGFPSPRGRGAQPRGDSSRKGGGEGGGTRTGMNEGRGRGKRGERRRAAAQSRGSPRSARPSPNPGPDGARSGTAPPTPPGGTHTRAAQRGAAAGTAAAAVEGPAWPAWGVGSMPVGARRCPRRRSAPARPGKSRTSLSSPRSAKALNAALAPPRPARDRPRGAERHRSSGAAPVPALCPQRPPPPPPLCRGMRCAVPGAPPPGR